MINTFNLRKRSDLPTLSQIKNIIVFVFRYYARRIHSARLKKHIPSYLRRLLTIESVVNYYGYLLAFATSQWNTDMYIVHHMAAGRLSNTNIRPCDLSLLIFRTQINIARMQNVGQDYALINL